jgi:predicted component of type VI protein secretion system
MSFLNRFLPEAPYDDTLASVVRNLQHLLNSRREYGSLLCRFGLTDYLTQQSGAKAAASVLSEIKDTIENYEPRLRLLNLKTLGQDAALWLHIDLQGMLLTPELGATPCRLLISFHPISGAVELLVPAASRPKGAALAGPVRNESPVPADVLAAASLAARMEARTLLHEHPECAPHLVVAALAARRELLPPELSSPAVLAGRQVLEAQPELAAALALIGQAAQAGLLPASLAGAAVQLARLATDSNFKVAEAAAVAGVAIKTGRLPPELAGGAPLSGASPATAQLVLLAKLAARSGLLPSTVASALMHSPAAALRSIPELSSALFVANLATRVRGLRSPAPLAEGRHGS